MYQHALKDIAAFEEMLHSDIFESDNIKIGAEQELCVTDALGQPNHHSVGHTRCS